MYFCGIFIFHLVTDSQAPISKRPFLRFLPAVLLQQLRPRSLTCKNSCYELVLLSRRIFREVAWVQLILDGLKGGLAHTPLIGHRTSRVVPSRTYGVGMTKTVLRWLSHCHIFRGDREVLFIDCCGLLRCAQRSENCGGDIIGLDNENGTDDRKWLFVGARV